MPQRDDQIQTLYEIRNIMDRTSRFQSLSGLAGISVGLVALVGVGALQWYMAIHALEYRDVYSGGLSSETTLLVAGTAAAVFCLAAVSALHFTFAKARKTRQSVWTAQSKRLLVNLCLPLAVGGAFCGVLLFHGIGYLVAPATLVFYGLALLNASRYTLADLRSLGLCELALGLVSGIVIEYGLLAWALGFGLLHLFYGGIMYYKYEKMDY